MSYEAGRKVLLKDYLDLIVEIYSLAREQGINSVRFLNNHQETRNVTEGRKDSVLTKTAYGGVTRLGSELHRKIIIPFTSNTMTKPLLVIVTTDGDVRDPLKVHRVTFNPIFPRSKAKEMVCWRK